MAQTSKQQLSKHAEYLTNLRKMVKSSELAQTNIKGTPAGDVTSEKMPDSTETTDKNGVGADKNKPQEYEQKPSSNEGEPLKGAKSASVQALAAEVISDVNKEAASNKTAELAQTNIKGTPAGDVESHKMPDSTEKTDKNSVGADKQNDKQKYEQKDSTNEHEPLKGAKKAEVDEMAAKVASFQLGRQFAAALLKQAAFAPVANNELLKEAGRRDFEQLIATATEEIQVDEPADEVLKQAEAAGESFFNDLLIKKESTDLAVANENKELKAKLAELESKLATHAEVTTGIKSTLDKEAAAKAEQEKEAAFAAKVAAMAATLAADIVEKKLQSESGK